MKLLEILDLEDEVISPFKIYLKQEQYSGKDEASFDTHGLIPILTIKNPTITVLRHESIHIALWCIRQICKNEKIKLDRFLRDTYGEETFVHSCETIFINLVGAIKC